MGFTWGYFTWTPKYVEWKNIYIRIDYFLGPPCMPVCRSVTTQVLWWGSQLLDQTVMILHVFWGNHPFLCIFYDPYVYTVFEQVFWLLKGKLCRLWFQPMWKIWSSIWVISLSMGWTFQNCLNASPVRYMASLDSISPTKIFDRNIFSNYHHIIIIVHIIISIINIIIISFPFSFSFPCPFSFHRWLPGIPDWSRIVSSTCELRWMATAILLRVLTRRVGEFEARLATRLHSLKLRVFAPRK